MGLTALLFLSSTVPGVAAEPRVVKLTVSPAVRPQPVTEYRLFPARRDLQAGNAAALYLRSQLLLPEDNRRDGEKLEELTSDPITDEAKWRAESEKLMARYQAVIEEAQLGAWRDRAVWDLPLREHGISTRLPEIQGVRSLARILNLQARLQLAKGQYTEASETLTTNFAMARHVGESGTLISTLVGIAISGIGCERCEQWIGQPDSPNLYWALTALPEPLVPLRAGLESEQMWLVAALPDLDLLTTTVLSEEQAQKLAVSLGELVSWSESDQRRRFPIISGEAAPAGNLLLPALADYSRFKRQLIEQGRPAAQVEAMPVAQVLAIRWTEEYLNMLDESLAWADRPYGEAMQGIRAIDERTAQVSKLPEGRLVELLLPALGAARTADARISQRLAVLRVVEALRLHLATSGGKLPESLAEIKAVPLPVDPLTNQPFRYRLDGATAILMPEPTHEEVRYEITVRLQNPQPATPAE